MMKRKKLILLTALFLVTALLLSSCNTKIPSQDKPGEGKTDTNSNGNAAPTTGTRYYQIDERIVEQGQGSRRFFSQAELVGNDLIFRGIFLYEEYFVLEHDGYLIHEDGSTTPDTFKMYYTHYIFRVTEVLKGDKSLENTEIYLMGNNNRYERILQAESEYFVMAKYYDADTTWSSYPDVIPLLKTNYGFSESQSAFPIEDDYVYSTKKLIDYDNFMSENCDNAFMNNWLEKQEVDKNDLIENWTKRNIQTIGGESERIVIPIDIFTDFLISAIEYYK